MMTWETYVENLSKWVEARGKVRIEHPELSLPQANRLTSRQNSELYSAITDYHIENSWPLPTILAGDDDDNEETPGEWPLVDQAPDPTRIRRRQKEDDDDEASNWRNMRKMRRRQRGSRNERNVRCMWWLRPDRGRTRRRH